MVITKKTALAGVLAALLVGGKLAIMFVPNVEIVTILLATAGFVFGAYVSVLAAFGFVAVETMLWGMGTWVASYLIHWPMVALVFSLLGMFWRARKKCFDMRLRIVSTVAAVVLTLLFGVLTSLVDVGLFTGSFENFWGKFALMYARGVLFFAIHAASNLAIFAAGFVPISAVMQVASNKMFKQTASE